MLRGERGQVASEYLGALLLVAVVVAALLTAGLGQRIADHAERAVCTIAGGPCDSAPASVPADTRGAAADLRALLGTDPAPAEVAAFFAGVDPAVANALALEHPELVGNLDGAPIRLRYAANATVMARERPDLYDPDRQILLFDPAGDRRIAEVIGNLETARHVAVVVLGMNNDLNNFSAGNAERVHAQASAFDPDQVATIQWLGYDTPEGATALGQGAAEPGAARLPGFVEGIRAQRRERLHWTVIGHSYGSLVVGRALAERGLEVDEVVFVGSPGVGVDHASDLGEGFNVWVGLARNDLVGYSQWHGGNPHARGFGATRFHTGDVSGHSSYFNEGSESLRNIGLITAGYLDDVNVNDGF